MPTAERLLRSLRRTLRRHRRLIGAGLVGVAALLALTELRPAPPPTTTVVLAGRDLPAAAALVEQDVTVASLPRSAVPEAALRSADDVLGQVLAGPVLAGEVLTPARFRGPSLVHGQPEGTVAVPLRLADAEAAALLSPGDRIDVVAATPEASDASVVARELAVLLAPIRIETSPVLAEAGGIVDTTGLGGGVVVLAVSPSQVPDLVAAGAQAPLWFALHGAGTP